MMVEYKSNLYTLDEQMKTSRLKLQEIIGETYKTIAQRIKMTEESLDMKMNRAKKETIKLQVQVETLAKENKETKHLLQDYFKRTDDLLNIING